MKKILKEIFTDIVASMIFVALFLFIVIFGWLTVDYVKLQPVFAPVQHEKLNNNQSRDYSSN